MCGSGRDRGGRADGMSGCSCGGGGRGSGGITGGEVCEAVVHGVIDRIGSKDWRIKDGGGKRFYSSFQFLEQLNR